MPRGGEAIVAYPHEPPTLDPFARGGDAPATRDLARLLLPALYRTGPDGERIPWLLAREPAVSQGRRFRVTVELRPDAVWSDGRPITARDLRFTWRAAARSAAREGYDRIRTVRVRSARRATIEFDRPFARWRDLFSAGLGVLPERALRGKDLRRALADGPPVSGGPFRLRKWTRGLELVFERNPRAWGGVSRLDRIRVRFVPDAVTALQLFRRGDVDALAGYHGVDLSRHAAAVPGATLSRDGDGTVAALLLNTRARALRDARVRRALGLSLDRRRIAVGLVREEGERIDRLDPLRRALFPRRADATRARRLLDGRRPRLTIALARDDELPGRVFRALLVQAGKTGFELTAVPLDPDRLWGEWLASSRMEAALVVWREPPAGSLRARFGSAFRPPRGSNYSGLADRALDRALERLDAAPSAARAAAAARRLADLAPVVPLYAPAVTVAARAELRGVRANGGADGPLWNAGEWYLEMGAAEESPAA